MNITKSIVLVGAIASVIILSAGCSSGSNAVNDPNDATIESYQLSQLDEGAYIQKNGSSEFIKFMEDGKGYDPKTMSSSDTGNTKIVWMANQDGLIPEVTNADKIILKTKTTIPSLPQIHPMEDYGYSIGCTLYEDSKSKTWGLSKEKYRSVCEGSSFNKNFKAANNDENTRLFDIGGKKITDSNVSTIGSITGLEQGKDYLIGLYNGTVYSEITAACDTHIFVDSLQTPYVATDYQYTKDGYIIVTLPDNMPNGYYYFDDVGLFKYTKSAS